MLHLVSRLCPTLCDPMDYSTLGSSLHGIYQARILEWVVISSSRGSSQSRDRTPASCVSCIGRLVLHHCASWEALTASCKIPPPIFLLPVPTLPSSLSAFRTCSTCSQPSMQVDMVTKNGKRGVFRQSDEQQCTIYTWGVCVCMGVYGMEVSTESSCFWQMSQSIQDVNSVERLSSPYL